MIDLRDRQRMIEKIHKELNERGYTDDMIMSNKTVERIVKLEKGINARLDTEYTGTLRQAKKELDILTGVLDSLTYITALRDSLIITKRLSE